MKLLLLSLFRNSNDKELYPEKMIPWIRAHFSGVNTILFFPYAVAPTEYDAYTQRVQQFFQEHFQIKVISAHHNGYLLEKIDGIYVGDGNTHRLLEELSTKRWLDYLQDMIIHGCPYLADNAGAEIICPGIYTTNSPPIMDKPSSPNGALALVPFQISVHFPDVNEPCALSQREFEIHQFLQVSHLPVIGLRDGTGLQRNGNKLVLLGESTARLFIAKQDPKEVSVDLARALKSVRPHSEGVFRSVILFPRPSSNSTKPTPPPQPRSAL